MRCERDRKRTQDLLRINHEAAVNHRGWNMAELIGLNEQMKEEKEYE